MEQKFKVIYLGQFLDESNEALITKRFAEKFKISQSKALKILKAGKEVTLHPGAEHVKAYKIKATLESLGLSMKLERVQNTNKETIKEPPPELVKENPTVETKPIAEDEKPEKPEKPAPESTARKSIDTSNMSLEPMQEESKETEETDETEPTNQDTAQLTEQEQKENKDNDVQVAADVNSPSWDLEPMKDESSDTENLEDESDDKPAVVKQEFVDLSKPSMVYEKKSEEAAGDQDQDQEKDSAPETEEKEPSRIVSLIKQFGGVVVAGLAGILFLLKKFGLLKFLKIGGVMAAAAYAGYSPEEACMGNGACEDAVSDQIDACWSYSELDQYDWENMPDEQYFELKPQIEEKFISCFRYEETGAQVLESPIDLRFDLMAMCDELSNPVSNCIEIAEKQIKTCYDRSEIIEPLKASGYDYYGTMLTDMSYYKNFYGCFEDNSGNMLFAEFVENMNIEVQQ